MRDAIHLLARDSELLESKRGSPEERASAATKV